MGAVSLTRFYNHADPIFNKFEARCVRFASDSHAHPVLFTSISALPASDGKYRVMSLDIDVAMTIDRTAINESDYADGFIAADLRTLRVASRVCNLHSRMRPRRGIQGIATSPCVRGLGQAAEMARLFD